VDGDNSLQQQVVQTDHDHETPPLPPCVSYCFAAADDRPDGALGVQGYQQQCWSEASQWRRFSSFYEERLRQLVADRRSRDVIQR